MDILLEHYTKINEVKSFDEYFASKNDPRPEKHEEKNMCQYRRRRKNPVKKKR